MYYKSFLILVFLVLFGPYSHRVTGQTTSDRRQPETNIKDPQKPTDSLPTVMPAAKAINAEALELYREGTKLTEAGQFPNAVETFQQALRLEPEYADAYSGLGRAQFKMRQWEKAALNFRRAIELRTKQRASQDAPHQKALTRESKEVSTQVTGAPRSTQIRQEANANVSTVKSLRPEPEMTRPRRHSEISELAQSVPTTAQTKLPKENKVNDAGVKPANPSQTTRQPQQQNKLSVPTEPTAKSSKVSSPQGNSIHAAGVKLPSDSDTTRRPTQRSEVSTSSQPVATKPQVTVPQQTKTVAAGLKPPNPEPHTTRQPPRQYEVSTPAQAIPKRAQVIPPPRANVTVAGVKLPNPELPMRQPLQRNEVSSLVLLGSTPPPVTLPQATSNTAAGLKLPSPESGTTREPQKQNETSIPAPAIPNSNVTLPQAKSSIAAGLKLPSPELEATRQPQKQNEVSTLAQTMPPTPQVTTLQANSGNAAGVNAPSPESETPRQPQRQNEVSTPAQTIATTPQVTLPQANSGNAAGVNPPIPESETTRQPQTPNEVSITAQAIPNSQVTTVVSNAGDSTRLPGENSGNAVGVNPPIPSETAPESKPAADDVTSLESNNGAAPDQKRQPERISGSMTVSPAPAALATANASPVSTTTFSDETALTRVYRIGASDVLDVRINDTQTSQSTLFTVTPSGLLEHPMLPEPLPVIGFTEDEIRAKIENELSKRALLHNPKVAVGVRDYASHTILVSGRVQDPGTKVLKREAIPLFVVVADAQPLPDASRVTVRRTEPDKTFEMDLNRAADMELLIRPGDVITLHPSVKQFIYIGGEVKSPGEKTFRGGLTLTQAIITAGGATPKSKVAEIGREDDQGFLVGTRFSLKDIHSGKAIDPPLKPGDRVVILP